MAQAATTATKTVHEIMGGLLKLDLSNWQCRSWDLPIYEDYKVNLHYPGFLFGSLFYIGLGTATYMFGRTMLRVGRSIITYFKTVGNAQKYLQPKVTGSNEAYTAVIYGAGTKAGRIYASFLAQKGFNLVLVERDQPSLNNLTQNLRFDNSHIEPLVTTIVLKKFDMDTFNKQVVNQLKAHKNSPVKLFINCKNARRKVAPNEKHSKQQMQNLQANIGESLMLDESVLNEDERYTLRQLWEPAITREEIFFTGKENIEGFVSLLGYFLPSMVGKDVDQPALINIDNQDWDDDCEDADDGEQ